MEELMQAHLDGNKFGAWLAAQESGFGLNPGSGTQCFLAEYLRERTGATLRVGLFAVDVWDEGDWVEVDVLDGGDWVEVDVLDGGDWVEVALPDWAYHFQRYAMDHPARDGYAYLGRDAALDCLERALADAELACV